MASANTDPATLGDDEMREAVRDRYALAARRTAEHLGAEGEAAPCCAPSSSASPCCTASGAVGADPITRDLYGDEAAQTSLGALAASLGCGNPTLLADLQPGQTVLDLGSGGGLDVLLSARRVGPTGKAYGLDMTPEMLELARRNQAEAGIDNAEFLAGTIEAVPLPDAAVDVVISNCVINLAIDKDPVLREAYRVLKPSGRFAVSDMVVLRPLPEPAQRAMALWTGCISGALLADDYVAKLAAAGFVDVELDVTRTFTDADLMEMSAPLAAGGVDVPSVVEAMAGAVASVFVRAVKPA